MGKLLSINETSQLMGIQVSTLYAWVYQRKIPHIKVGRLVKFDSADIEAWITAHKVKTHEIWDKP